MGLRDFWSSPRCLAEWWRFEGGPARPVRSALPCAQGLTRRWCARIRWRETKAIRPLFFVGRGGSPVSPLPFFPSGRGAMARREGAPVARVLPAWLSGCARIAPSCRIRRQMRPRLSARHSRHRRQFAFYGSRTAGRPGSAPTQFVSESRPGTRLRVTPGGAASRSRLTNASGRRPSMERDIEHIENDYGDSKMKNLPNEYLLTPSVFAGTSQRRRSWHQHLREISALISPGAAKMTAAQRACVFIEDARGPRT